MCPTCPQNPRIGKEFEKFYSNGFEILMPDPNLSPIACASGLLLMLDTIYSHLAWSLWRLLIQENIRFGSEFIDTGFEILTPDPKFYLRRWFQGFLFVPDPSNCWIHILKIPPLHILFFIFIPDPILFMPDPELLIAVTHSRDFKYYRWINYLFVNCLCRIWKYKSGAE